MPHILSLLQQLQPILSKTTIRQLYAIVMAMLVMPANITQKNIARWAKHPCSGGANQGRNGSEKVG
jgi:flagellar biosynthesis regulator FlbT